MSIASHKVVRVGVAQHVQLREIIPSEKDEQKMIEVVQANATHAIKLVDQALM